MILSYRVVIFIRFRLDPLPTSRVGPIEADSSHKRYFFADRGVAGQLAFPRPRE